MFYLSSSQKYKEDLTSQDNDSSHLDGPISLLTHTSKVIELFNRKENITSDRSLKDLDRFYSFMREWREKKLLTINIALSQPSSGLMCSPCDWDLDPWWS